MMKRLRASKNSCSESKVAALTVTVEGGLPSPVSTITDDSAVVRFITKLVTLAHRKSHGPHWSALVERPTASSQGYRAEHERGFPRPCVTRLVTTTHRHTVPSIANKPHPIQKVACRHVKP